MLFIRMSLRLLSVIAGYPHPIKAAAVDRAARELRISHELLDLGCYSTRYGRRLYRALQLPLPSIILPTVLFGANVAARRLGNEIGVLTRFLQRQKYDVLMVYGDLTGSVAAAIAACEIGSFLVHVEAGRRSFDPEDGEEFNRCQLSRLANLHLAPSSFAKKNLIQEGHPHRTVIDAGSTAVETLSRIMNGSTSRYPRSHIDVLAAFHRHETLVQASRKKAALEFVSRVSQELSTALITYSDSTLEHEFKNARSPVILIDRLQLRKYLDILRQVKVVVTDSTGLQDDSLALGIPCVTMRDSTHCVESIEAGTNVVVGHDPEKAFCTVMQRVDADEPYPTHLDWGEDAGRRAISGILRAFQGSSSQRPHDKS
jgi:UDP-N-acetylglucosamine 2-epimerase